MEEVKKEQPVRTIEDVTAEYQRLCLRSGDVGYRIWALKKDLEMIQSTMRDLNLEAAQMQARLQAAEAKKEQVSNEPQS